MDPCKERVPKSESEKQLMLRYGDPLNNGIKIKRLSSLNVVESLTLCYYNHQQNELESKVEQFPNLRTLFISEITHRTHAQILSILRKGTNLESLIIDSKKPWSKSQDEDEDEDEVIFDYLINVNFHDEFIKIIGNRDMKIEFKEEDKTFGVVTKDEIIWRKKLLHWIGYDPIHNHSDIRLLDLASIPKESTAKHKQPLNLIFNYLDLNSLYAFCKASKQCKQLVHNYIYQKCKQQSKKRPTHRSIERNKFMITNEFGINYNSLRMFGKSIINLDVTLFSYEADFKKFRRKTEEYCKHLTHLTLRTMYRIDPYCYIIPQIRHFTYYGYGSSEDYIFYCALSGMASQCPKLEVLELKTPIVVYDGNWKKIPFKNLRRIKFKPHDDAQGKSAEQFFKGTSTEIIVDKSV